MAVGSTYLDNKLLNLLFKGTAFTALSTTYVALHATAGATMATADWVATEFVTASQTAYARVAATSAAWGTPSAGLITNTSAITFPTAGNAWGAVNYFSIWDSSAIGSGNLIFAGPLSVGRTVASGDVFSFAASNLTIGFQ